MQREDPKKLFKEIVEFYNARNTLLGSQLEEVVKRNTQLEILNQIAQSFTLQLSFDEMIEDVAQKLQKVISFDLLNLCVVDSNGDLVVKKELPRGKNVLGEGTVLDPATSWSWEVLRRKRFAIRADMQGDGEPYTAGLLRIGMRSAVVVPLLTRNGPIGTLNLGSRRLGAYSIEDAAFLQQVADLLALIIESSRLYRQEIMLKEKWEESYRTAKNLAEEMEKRNTQLEIINQIAKSITVVMSYQDIISNISEKLKRVISFDFLDLCLVEDGVLGVKASEPREGGAYEGAVFDEGSGPVRAIREKRMIVRPAISAGAEESFSEDTGLIKKGVGSQIMAPLMVKGTAVGVLILGSRSSYAYSKEEEIFLQQVADQLSLCVENYYLYKEESRMKRAWEETFKAVTDMLIVIDRRCRIVRFNETAEVLGRERNIFPEVGRRWHECFGPDQQDYILHSLKEVFRTAQPLFQRLHLQSGGVWDVSVYPILRDDGAVNEVILSIRDVTEKVSFEAQLIQSAKLAAIGEIAAGIAHELNSPLTAIIGNSLILERDASIHPPEKKVLLESIKKCGERCKNIILKLRAFARQEKYSFEPLNLNAVVEDALSLVAYEIEKSNIRIVKRLSGGLPPVVGSAQHLEQVLVNLLINARDSLAGREVREIHLETGQEKDFLYAAVCDTGCGIDGEKLKKIFSPFFTTKTFGTGLGLSISKDIAEAHGGRIEVQSRPGEGSRFTLFLPLKRGEADEDSP